MIQPHPNEAAGPEVRLQSLRFDEFGPLIDFSGTAIPVIAEHLADIFKRSGATNFLAVEFYSQELGPLELTMQRRRGKTPADIAMEYATKIEKIRDVLAIKGASRDKLDRIREIIGWRCDVCGFLLIATATCETAQRVTMDNVARSHASTCTSAVAVPAPSPSFVTDPSSVDRSKLN